MTSTQLICFFIAHRGLDDRSWSPFLDSLPATFDEHPLMWTLGLDGSYGRLCLSLLPQRTQEAVSRVRDRFVNDLEVMKQREVNIHLCET